MGGGEDYRQWGGGGGTILAWKEGRTTDSVSLCTDKSLQNRYLC